MHLFTSDFAVDRAVIYADENCIVYEDSLPELQNTWNALARHYIQQAEESRKSQNKTELFRQEIDLASKVNRTALMFYDRITNGDITGIPIEEKPSPTVNLKRFILSQVLEILRKKKEELLVYISEEKEAAQELASITQPVMFVDNHLRIYLDSVNYLEYKKEKDMTEYQLTGLLCVIKYRGMVISGYSKGNPKNYYDAAAEYFYERQACQEFSQGPLTISVTAQYQETSNPVCLAVLAELRCQTPLKELSEKVIIALSRFVLDLLLSGSPTRVLNVGDERLLDGRSAVFFVIENRKNNIFKVSRTKAAFEIRKNGIPVDYVS